jgi:hypothetical protein
MSFFFEVTAVTKAAAIDYFKVAPTQNKSFPQDLADTVVRYIELMSDHGEFGVKVLVQGHICDPKIVDYPSPSALKIEVQNLWLLGKEGTPTAEERAAIHEAGQNHADAALTLVASAPDTQT